jgi:hypothetical protein
LKDGSWEGSASDFCSKHGENHLTNVYLVAIKERSKHFENSTSSEKQPFSDIEKAVGKFLKTVAPSKSNPITPIAIFRKLRKVAQ